MRQSTMTVSERAELLARHTVAHARQRDLLAVVDRERAERAAKAVRAEQVPVEQAARAREQGARRAPDSRVAGRTVVVMVDKEVRTLRTSPKSGSSSTPRQSRRK